MNVMRKLKFCLDRKSLEIIYLIFIRPILDYADVVWDNCTNYEKQELNKIQTEAARIVTGATKLVSLHAFFDEVKWEPLEAWRMKHRLLLLYKMFNNLSPEYLSSLIPPTVSNISRYNLCNAQNIQTIDSRTTQYFDSFLPSPIREWNNLSLDVRNSDSIMIFKRKLDSDIKSIPRYLYAGNRRAQVLHARLRTKCSSLFQKRINDSPLCLCGNVENTDHYFVCVDFTMHREQSLFMKSSSTPKLLYKFSYLEILYRVCTQILSF